MTITLYKAALDVQQKIALCVDEDGVIDVDKMNEIEATFTNKAIAVTAYTKTLDAKDAMLKQYIAEVQATIAKNAKQREAMRTYLANGMKSTGITSIESEDGLISAKLYIDRDESVVLDPSVTFADELCNPAKPPPPLTPSKKLIKAAIERGEFVAGAQIVRNDRLTIA